METETVLCNRNIFVICWKQKAKTEDGRTYYIEKPQHDQRCLLKCSDGTFEMPAYTIVFHEE